MDLRTAAAASPLPSQPAVAAPVGGSDTPLTRFLRAGEAGDVAAARGALHPDVRLVSPMAGGAVMRGPDDVALLLGEVYAVLRGLEWVEHYADGRVHTVLGRARALGVALTDAMLVTVAEDGRVLEIRPHLRPWAGLTAFSAALLPRLLRHPGLLARSTRPD